MPNTTMGSPVAHCFIVNVSSRPLTVSATIRVPDGTVVSDLGNQTVAPQATVHLATNPFSIGQGATVRCVILFSGSAKGVRASLEVINNNTGETYLALPAN
jgi:hypothetical protein